MKKQIALTLSACTALALSGPSCSTSAKYVQPDSQRLITNVGQINIQDYAAAADAMVNSLIDQVINPGKLKTEDGSGVALLAISRIQNSTGQQIDTDLLTKKMRVSLSRTGKVQTFITFNLGDPEDPLAKDRVELENTRTQQRRLPDYTLSGKIIEDRAQAGRVQQSAYVFQLSLTSPQGIAVWEEEKTIVKQGSRPSIGF
jgi:penicillin-binding protein activator